MKNKMNFNNTPIDWNEVHNVIDNSEKSSAGDGKPAEINAILIFINLIFFITTIYHIHAIQQVEFHLY